MLKRLPILLALVITLAIPFLLRPKNRETTQADDTLVIITPHNEAIRHEFAEGFRAWWHQRTGRTVHIDWRVIGGTSEIARFLEGEYVAAFQNHWINQLGKPWSTEIQAAFQAPTLPADAPALSKEARAAFLASNVSCNIDLFFGGGTYDFDKQAQAGRIVDSGVRERHPEWFTPDVIPQSFAGEEYWDKQGRWIGTVLSAYGIVYNTDGLTRVGLPNPPTQWDDLGNPRFVGQIALADPTKSGSIAKAFENVIQQQMQRRLLALQAKAPAGTDPKALETQAIREGWIAGLRLLQLIGANSRYFTDSSQKPPIDVAAGDCAVGMCIDFYGRQQQEAVTRRSGSSRVGYASPVGGSVSSVDPIALLRGAKNRAVAEAFIDYTLSMDGQKLWNLKPGTPGGPQHFALRRLPVRKDFYQQADLLPLRSDPTDAPYASTDQLIYRAAWTTKLFREMSFIIRMIALDSHAELVEAWKAIVAARMPADAIAVMQDLSAVDYVAAGDRIKKNLGSKNKVDEVKLANELSSHFRAQYRRAAELARQAQAAGR